MLLWCHVFQALCGFFESVRIQEKSNWKAWSQGTFSSGLSRCDLPFFGPWWGQEVTRSPASSQSPRGSHQHPARAGRASDPHRKTSPSPHGPGIQRPEQGGMKTWLHRQEHSLQGDTHQKEYGHLEGRCPRTKSRLRYRCGGQASSGPHSVPGAHLKLGS